MGFGGREAVGNGVARGRSRGTRRVQRVEVVNLILDLPRSEGATLLAA
jgi:hypothetical protein